MRLCCIVLCLGQSRQHAAARGLRSEGKTTRYNRGQYHYNPGSWLPIPLGGQIRTDYIPFFTISWLIIISACATTWLQGQTHTNPTTGPHIFFCSNHPHRSGWRRLHVWITWCRAETYLPWYIHWPRPRDFGIRIGSLFSRLTNWIFHMVYSRMVTPVLHRAQRYFTKANVTSGLFKKDTFLEEDCISQITKFCSFVMSLRKTNSSQVAARRPSTTSSSPFPHLTKKALLRWARG